MSSTAIVRVALPVPLYKQFDYLLPAHIQTHAIPTGARVLVPFGARKLVGFVCDLPDHSDIAPSRLKPIIAVLDHSKATLNNELFELGHWISRYYHHPLGLTFETMVPTLLRKSKIPATKTEHIFCLDMEQEFNDEQLKFESVSVFFQQQPDGQTDAAHITPQQRTADGRLPKGAGGRVDVKYLSVMSEHSGFADLLNRRRPPRKSSRSDPSAASCQDLAQSGFRRHWR